jgi:hypothetical protein
MVITQQPIDGAIYFQKSVPDIILTKNVGLTSATFNLKIGGVSILLENYLYDINDKIYIRNIYEVCEKYLNADNLIQSFTYDLTDTGGMVSSSFTLLKCDADMTVDADSWTAQNFLTRSYRKKRTSKSRNEYLSFLQKQSYGAVTLHYQVFYQNWETGAVVEQSGTLTAAIAASAGMKITTFNASWGALREAMGLGIDTKVYSLNIWLTGTGFETNKYTYLYDNSAYRSRNYYVFVNCFGVLETFTATGRTDAKKKAELNMGNIENRYRKITQDFVNEKTVNSGFLSDEEMEWIDDMILSFAVSTYTPGVTGSDEEITITNFEKTDTEANELQSFSFNYRRSKNNHLQFVNAARGIFDDTFDETFN